MSTAENNVSVSDSERSDTERWSFEGGLGVNDLRKSFFSPAGNRLEVLCGASFSAQPGESVAIIGSSGAGKSTLLHLLGGLEAPDHGSISLGEFAIDRAQSSELAAFRRRHVGLVFQFHYLLHDLSAIENVALPLRLERKDKTSSLQQARALLTEVGMASRCDHPVSHLSGGEQQRVAACRALIKQPALILADEPTGNLDAAASDELGLLLLSKARQRQAILVIATHNEQLAQLCDQILKIDEGRLKSCR